MRVVLRHGITVKQLSQMCGWSYQNLRGFLNFRSFPKKENKEELFTCLKRLDPDITYEEVFPKEFKIAQKVFHSTTRITDIPLDQIEYRDPDLITLEDR
jgi:hypothetical protein